MAVNPIPFKLPDKLEGMYYLRDGTGLAGVSEVPHLNRRYNLGSVLFVIETDGPASIGLCVELTSPFDCIVNSLFVSEGQTVVSGQVLGLLQPFGN